MYEISVYPHVGFRSVPDKFCNTPQECLQYLKGLIRYEIRHITITWDLGRRCVSGRFNQVEQVLQSQVDFLSSYPMSMFSLNQRTSL